MKLKSKLFAGAVTFAMVLSVAVPASAATVAELQAQIASLLAMINQLQAQLAGQTSSTGGYTYSADLTLGSTGADVTALQQFLMSKGQSIPALSAGAAYGYFGPQTQAALAAYQASVGISPPVGYFGPITRAHMNAMVGTTSGTTGGTTTSGSTGISTPGVEGTIAVTQNNSGIDSTVYEGESKVKILGFDVEAKLSDVAVQRVKVNLGTNSKIYTKGYDAFYVMDKSGNVLASTDASEVYKDGSTYYVTITGFSYVIPKDTEEQMFVGADIKSSIDSTDRTTLTAITTKIAANGIRAVDGAGIDQYSPTSALTGRTTTFSAELAESATLKLSLNSSSPEKTDLVATDGSDSDELDDLTLLVFDLKAQKDDVKVTDLYIEIEAASAGGATASTSVSVYDGSTELDSASLTGTAEDTAYFANLDYVVPKDTTKTLTVKVDVIDANGTRQGFTAKASSTGIVAENTLGDSATDSGSATGYEIGVTNVGPEISLTSKSITTSGVPQSDDTTVGLSTSTLAANFSVKIKAVGGDLYLGDVTSSTPLISSSTGFSIYRNGADDATIGSNSTSTSFTIPSICSTSGQTASCLLGEGNEVTVPMAYQIQGRSSNNATALTAGLYSIEISELKWNGNSTTFMAGETAWRTADVSFP